MTVVLAIYFYQKVFLSEDKSELLIGDTTYGHYQIEMECSACHTDPFGGPEVLQDACVNCHAQELEDAHDSHPKKKFTDPREAYRIEILDARYCISCHTEHHKDRTHEMGLTLPDDYCYHCHKEVGDERESHKDLPFDSCASAGCHNYHDNRALYEDFLVKNANQPWLKEIATIASTQSARELLKKKINIETYPFPEKMEAHPEPTLEWQASKHAEAGVNCGGCHSSNHDSTSDQNQTLAKNTWIEKPTIEQCANCHETETKTFKQGKHGMRLADGLDNYSSAITAKESNLAFKSDILDVQHGCNSCHGAHNYDTKKAAVEGCLTCHADDHSKNFKLSPHAMISEKLNEAANQSGANSASEVTCATCHMPKIQENIDGHQVFKVNHNQNDNLRPNEKMIRSVCMDCHGLGFAIDALADPELIKNNFNGKPGIHIESIDWSIKRIKE